MKIITFASWKGGTGKTSLATACIELLAKLGRKILIIDLDSNLSMTSVYNITNWSDTSINLLNGDKNIVPYKHNEYTYIFPSDLRIARLNNISDRVLKINFAKTNFNISKFDYIFIDPPGTMNALTRNAMVTADKIIIPAMFSDIDYQATELILEEMELCGVEADIQIVLNRYDEKRNTPGIEEKFRDRFKDFIWNKKIPAMKSINRLTSELTKCYTLHGRAKQIMTNFVKEVIL